jgi:hypothetical protein
LILSPRLLQNTIYCIWKWQLASVGPAGYIELLRKCSSSNEPLVYVILSRAQPHSSPSSLIHSYHIAKHDRYRDTPSHALQQTQKPETNTNRHAHRQDSPADWPVNRSHRDRAGLPSYEADQETSQNSSNRFPLQTTSLNSPSYYYQPISKAPAQIQHQASSTN